MPEASGIPIHCAYDELADITTLIPNPRNPNTHPEKQVQLLAKIIKNQGWRAPITVSNRSGFIVRGHGRLLAAQLLGVEQVPVDRQDMLRRPKSGRILSATTGSRNWLRLTMHY